MSTQAAPQQAHGVELLQFGPRYDERSVSTDNLHDWRRTILSAVATALADPRMPELQKQGALWKWNDQIPYPALHDLLVLDNGCLKFEVKIGEHVAVFSIWMMVGEVRVGAKIPHPLLSGAIRDRIAKAYDGSPCQRVENMGQATMYDWIWKNTEFSEFGFMVKSLRDPMLASVIADRLAAITIHLYMAVVNTLIEGLDLKVAFRRISRVPLKRVLVHVVGDYDTFQGLLQERGYTVDLSVFQPDGSKLYLILMPINGIPLPQGHIRDQDSGECIIVSVKDAPEDGIVERRDGDAIAGWGS